MIILYLLLILITFLVAILFLVAIFLYLTLEKKRVLPLGVGICTYILVVLFSDLYAHLIPRVHLRHLVIPVILSAAATALMCRRKDWEDFEDCENVLKPNYVRDSLAIVAAIIGAIVGAYTMIGNWLLNSLGHLVIGDIPGEKGKIITAGMFFGFGLGGFSFLYLWTCISKIQRTPIKDSVTDDPESKTPQIHK